MRLEIDSGATFSCIKAKGIEPAQIEYLASDKKIVTTNQLKIGDCEFGAKRFVLVDIASSNYDGALGADFMLEYAVCFDYPNKMVYIHKPMHFIELQYKIGKYRLTQWLIK